MGFSIINIEFPELVLLFSFLNKLLGHIKAYSFRSGRHDHDHQLLENRPSASLVPVPVFFMVQSVKNQLPVLQYSCLVNRRSGSGSGSGGGTCDHADEDDPTSCIICMNCINRSDEVRELSSCNHVFHRDCLDSWIDHGNMTCPLCKSKLLATQGSNSRFGNDPWRKERMIYLFGEDEMTSTCL